MTRINALARLLVAFSVVLVISASSFAQGHIKAVSKIDNSDFGPVMRAYLGYLRNEQEVVDDRISRREISSAYYRRNSNRIKALRQMAIRLVNQSGNDYVPELEAVTIDEFGTLFERPPRPTSFRSNEILTNKFRYLGVVHAGEVFYIFARLDPYEQASLIERQSKDSMSGPADASSGVAKGQPVGQTSTRPKRTVPR